MRVSRFSICSHLLAMGLWGTIFFVGHGAAYAAAGAPPPIHIEADLMESETRADVFVFSGHVEARQDDVVIFADKMTVVHAGAPRGQNKGESDKNNDISKIVAEGHVKIIKGEWTATGLSLEYFAEGKRVILTGGVKVWQKDNMIEGERIVLNLEDGKSVVERGSERVKAFIYPEKGQNEAR